MKALICILASCSFLVIALSPFPASGRTIDLTIEGDALSANLKGTPLKEILEELEKETGISWRVHESVLEERVTVQFEALSLKNGLKRILSSTNYCLVFDSKERLNSVIIVGRKGLPGGSPGVAKINMPPVPEEGLIGANEGIFKPEEHFEGSEVAGKPGDEDIELGDTGMPGLGGDTGTEPLYEPDEDIEDSEVEGKPGDEDIELGDTGMPGRGGDTGTEPLYEPDEDIEGSEVEGKPGDEDIELGDTGKPGRGGDTGTEPFYEPDEDIEGSTAAGKLMMRILS